MKRNNERDQKIKSRQAGIGADSAIAQLIDTVEKSSRAANKLTEKIKFLNWILVILGTIGLIMAGFSLYMQYFSN
jgi:biotin synthase-related radical SAM superfamily protein